MLLAYIDKDELPTEMATLRINMLWSTTPDEELTEITGDDGVILPPLVDAFPRHFPKYADKIGERQN